MELKDAILGKHEGQRKRERGRGDQRKASLSRHFYTKVRARGSHPFAAQLSWPCCTALFSEEWQKIASQVAVGVFGGCGGGVKVGVSGKTWGEKEWQSMELLLLLLLLMLTISVHSSLSKLASFSHYLDNFLGQMASPSKGKAPKWSYAHFSAKRTGPWRPK